MEREELRSTVLNLLNNLYMPVSVDDLELYSQAVNKFLITTEELVNLIDQERADFDAGVMREVWACPALDFPSGIGDSDYLTRSDWPVHIRLIDEGGPSEAQELMLLRQFCDIAVIMEEESKQSEVYDLLMERIYDLAILIPKALLEERLEDNGEARPAGIPIPARILIIYREIAEDMYGEIKRSIALKQRECAEAIERLATPERYFGRSE